MTIYRAPIDDVIFLLNDVFKIDRYNNLPGFGDVTRDVRSAVLIEAARLSEEVLHPLNSTGDQEGCRRLDDGSVQLPQGFKQAFREIGDGGWVGLSAPLEYGGQNFPSALTNPIVEFMSSANMSLWMYSSLARGAVEALLVHGTNEQKATYVPKMLAGQWGGTMNLTEPHSGTDLGMMRSRAVRQTNDSYKISGTKIFISGGEQDLTENIIHLVLAKIEGGPPGIKGVSLFLVPKILLNNDGSLGERNGVSCASIEHKMGIRGNSTCVLNFEDATGWLVGSEHKGMEAMFVMMNEARLGTGVQGLAQSEIAYQNAVAYARDRLQGRALTGAVAPEKPADPIIVHPDVRRTLMTIRAFNEGARALVMWTSLRGDVASRSDDAQERQQAHNDMSLLTPMIKGFLTDRGFASAVSAQQLFGGHGYIVETGVEQFVRDARITMLYEGANGIQALDLVARKLPKDGGRSMTLFCDEIEALITDNKSNETLHAYIAPLATAVNHLRQATVFILNNAIRNPNNAAAASTDYLQLFGLVALGYMWAQIAITASDKISDGDTNAFLQAKLITGAFYAETSLLESAVLLARIQNGAARIMELTADAF